MQDDRHSITEQGMHLSDDRSRKIFGIAIKLITLAVILYVIIFL